MNANFIDKHDGTAVYVDIAILVARTVTIDIVSGDGEDCTTAWLTPKQARKMAKALKRAAARAEDCDR